MERKQGLGKYKRLVIGVVVLLALIAALRTFTVPDCATIQQKMADWGVWAPIIFFFVYVIACVAFIPGTIVTLMAGLAFGAWWGTALVSLSSMAGAIISFLIARYLARDAVESFLGKQAWFNKFRASVEDNGFNFMLFVRLVPLFPFNGLNYASGLVPIKFKDYALASWIGMLPGTFVYVYLGETGCKLIDPMVQGKFHFSDFPPEVRNSFLIAIALLAALSVLPLLLKKFRNRGGKPS